MGTWVFFIILSIGFGIVLGITCIITYTTSVNTVSSLEARRDSIDAYKIAIEKTESILLVGRNALQNNNQNLRGSNIAIDGPLTDSAYSNLATEQANRIKEYRDEVISYNKTLRKYRKWNSIPILNTFVIDVPEYLEPLKVEQ